MIGIIVACVPEGILAIVTIALRNVVILYYLRDVIKISPLHFTLIKTRGEREDNGLFNFITLVPKDLLYYNIFLLVRLTNLGNLVNYY